MANGPRAHLTSRIEQGVLVLTITEPHLRSDKLVDALRQDFLAVVDQTGVAKVVLDMRQVELLSSTGLRPMLGLHRHLQPRGGELVLCGLAPEVARVFTITRLVGMSGSPFTMAPDVPAALARLTAAAN
jgi:anti-anti-sigma factor